VVHREPSLSPRYCAAFDDVTLPIAALFEFLGGEFGSAARAAKQEDRLFFGEATNFRKMRGIQLVERDQARARDVNFSVLGRSSDVEEVKSFAGLKAIVELPRCDGVHIQVCR
jgi:hypothetical protein